jgi:hypothetical protein
MHQQVLILSDLSGFFRANKDTTGNVVCYKARLIAQGFSQVPGVNYFDTYVSRLVYKGSKACVSERRRPNTANPEDLVRRRYVVGKGDQTSSNIKGQVSNR